MPSQKNEIRRETKFYSWWPSTKNYAGLVLLAVVFPAFLYTGNRADLVSAPAAARAGVPCGTRPPQACFPPAFRLQVTKATKKRGSKTAQEDYL